MLHPSKILASLGIPAVKARSQNFLVSQNVLEGLENYLSPGETVLEIGPGLGAVTEYLLAKNFRITAVEKDNKLAEYLKENLVTAFTSLTLIHEDFLKLKTQWLQKEKFTQVIGNLPFNITTPIITEIILELPQVKTFIMGIQKEVGQRLLKAAGSSLALLIKSQGDFVFHRIIGKNNFFPVPNVDVMWLVWVRNQKIEDTASFELFLRALFWGKRKNMYSVLTKNPFFKEEKITEKWKANTEKLADDLKKLRADQLNFEQIKNIFLQINN